MPWSVWTYFVWAVFFAILPWSVWTYFVCFFLFVVFPGSVLTYFVCAFFAAILPFFVFKYAFTRSLPFLVSLYVLYFDCELLSWDLELNWEILVYVSFDALICWNEALPWLVFLCFLPIPTFLFLFVLQCFVDSLSKNGLSVKISSVIVCFWAFEELELKSASSFNILLSTDGVILLLFAFLPIAGLFLFVPLTILKVICKILKINDMFVWLNWLKW